MVRARNEDGLPAMLRPYFWEYRFADLTWKTDREFVIQRVLEEGNWDAICWLRRRVGYEGIARSIRGRRGRGLSRRQLRYWELMLDLPRREVNAWLRLPGRQIWYQRAARR